MRFSPDLGYQPKDLLSAQKVGELMAKPCQVWCAILHRICMLRHQPAGTDCGTGLRDRRGLHDTRHDRKQTNQPPSPLQRDGWGLDVG